MLESNFVILFGGSGTVGHYLQKILKEKKIKYVAPSHSDCDLLDPSAIGRLMESYRHLDPKNIIFVNLAAKRTNISTNVNYPVETYTQTLQMSINYFAAAQRHNIGRVLSFVSSCAYPHEITLMKESDIDSGPPHGSVSCHALAKRSIVHMSDFYRLQYGLDSSVLVLNNLYGFWHRGVERYENCLKVADSLVRKFVEAKKNNIPVVECYGTGKPMREFLYFKDAAESVYRFLKKNPNIDLINIGNGQEISIWDLVYMIKDLVEYDGNVVWLNDKPDGQLRKLLDNQRMEEFLSWSPPTKLIDGLKQTVEWYTREISNV